MAHLTTDQKGQLACLKVQEEAMRKGAIVSFPSIPSRYDLILDYRGKLYRAQVKYADGKTPNAQGSIKLDLKRRGRCYTQEEIDVLLVYLPQIDKVCWIEPSVFHNKMSLCLRLQPAKNRQKNGCRMVTDLIW
jgi:hypothetical protein